ncbi:MAG: hypothetical protein RIB78_11845 [Gammaproteobacteria bacterium]
MPMFVKLINQHALPISTCAICTLLLAYNVFTLKLPLTAGNDVNHEARSIPVTIDERVLQADPAPELSSFSSMVSRPLFNEERQPFVAEKTAINKPVEKRLEQTAKLNDDKLMLSAVIITPEQKLAIIENEREKANYTVALGEYVDHWQLTEVFNHSVTLSKDNQTRLLELEYKPSINRPASKNIKQASKSENLSQSLPNNIDNNQPGQITDPVDPEQEFHTGLKNE